MTPTTRPKRPRMRPISPLTKPVRYCPGEAPGAPAFLRPDVAERQLQADKGYPRVRQRLGRLVHRWPHLEAIRKLLNPQGSPNRLEDTNRLCEAEISATALDAFRRRRP